MAFICYDTVNLFWALKRTDNGTSRFNSVRCRHGCRLQQFWLFKTCWCLCWQNKCRYRLVVEPLSLTDWQKSYQSVLAVSQHHRHQSVQTIVHYWADPEWNFLKRKAFYQPINGPVWAGKLLYRADRFWVGVSVICNLLKKKKMKAFLS